MQISIPETENISTNFLLYYMDRDGNLVRTLLDSETKAIVEVTEQSYRRSLHPFLMIDLDKNVMASGVIKKLNTMTHIRSTSPHSTKRMSATSAIYRIAKWSEIMTEGKAYVVHMDQTYTPIELEEGEIPAPQSEDGMWRLTYQGLDTNKVAYLNGEGNIYIVGGQGQSLSPELIEAI